MHSLGQPLISAPAPLPLCALPCNPLRRRSALVLKWKAVWWSKNNNIMEGEKVGPMDGFAFAKNKDGTVNKQIVICTHCSKTFSFHRSCSSLKYHISAKHALVGASSSETGGLRQGTLDTRRPLTKSTVDKLNNAIARWIAMDCRPISIVEDIGLANVLKVATLDTSYKPPARSTTMTRIHELYETERGKKKEATGSAESVALTGDHWTSVSNTNYLGVTAHHITETWELLSFALTVMTEVVGISCRSPCQAGPAGSQVSSHSCNLSPM